MDSQLIEKYKQVNWDQLLRKDLGNYSLEIAKPNLDRIKSIFDFLIFESPELHELSDTTVNQIESSVTDFINNICRNISSFQDTTKRNDIIITIKRKESDIVDSIGKYYHYLQTINLSRKNKELEDYKHEIELKFQESTQELEGKIKVADEKLSQLDSLIDSYRDKTAEFVISDYAEIFKEQAYEHSHWKYDDKKRMRVSVGNSEKWLIMGFFSLVVFIYILLNLRRILGSPSELFGNELYSFLITKIFIISMSFYWITFCFKNFSIHRHLSTLNMHRSNALGSFKLFLNSVDREDNSVRNTLVIEVAKAIYEQGKTGYLGSRDKEVTSSPIIELTRLAK